MEPENEAKLLDGTESQKITASELLKPGDSSEGWTGCKKKKTKVTGPRQNSTMQSNGDFDDDDDDYLISYGVHAK